MRVLVNIYTEDSTMRTCCVLGALGLVVANLEADLENVDHIPGGQVLDAWGLYESQQDLHNTKLVNLMECSNIEVSCLQL